MILPGFGLRLCSYEVMAAAGCPRRRPTSHSQVNPSLEDGWCMGQAAAARNIVPKRTLLEHSLRKNRALLRDFIISVGVSRKTRSRFEGRWPPPQNLELRHNGF